MNKRSKEIEDAISYLDLYEGYSPYQEAWRIVYDYIEQLERSKQELLNMKERIMDDGK